MRSLDRAKGASLEGRTTTAARKGCWLGWWGREQCLPGRSSRRVAPAGWEAGNGNRDIIAVFCLPLAQYSFRDRHRLQAVGNSKFPEDSGDMYGGCTLGNKQSGRYLPIGQSVSRQ